MEVKPDGEGLKFQLLRSLGQEDQKFKAFWVADKVRVPWPCADYFFLSLLWTLHMPLAVLSCPSTIKPSS